MLDAPRRAVFVFFDDRIKSNTGEGRLSYRTMHRARKVRDCDWNATNFTAAAWKLIS